MFPKESIASAPPWLRWFVTDVTRAFMDMAALAPLGCHYFHDEVHKTWEVTLFVSRTEIVGGPQDGQSFRSEMTVDLGRVFEAFDQPPSSWWQSDSVADDDQLGNHLSFLGNARGHHVWLRILHDSPTGIGPGRLTHAAGNVVEDIW